jgi:outer membrane protein
MPLYTRGQIQNRVKETLVLEDRSLNDLEAARRGVSQATRQAFYTLQSGAAQVRALEAAESSSLLALEATQLGYRVGVRVNLDVLNAQTQLFQTRRDLARARYDVLLNNLRLRQAAGQVTAQDIAAVDRLLAR